MLAFNDLEALFIITSFLLQAILIAHFALRRWRFEFSLRYGWLVYALSIPATAVSVILLWGGLAWSFWLGGFIYLVWAIFGFVVEYVKEIAWRSPIRWSIFAPYLFLYLATIMFYWWPLALISRPLWYIYAILFVVSTLLNITSHKQHDGRLQQT